MIDSCQTTNNIVVQLNDFFRSNFLPAYQLYFQSYEIFIVIYFPLTDIVMNNGILYRTYYISGEKQNIFFLQYLVAHRQHWKQFPIFLSSLGALVFVNALIRHDSMYSVSLICYFKYIFIFQQTLSEIT